MSSILVFKKPLLIDYLSLRKLIGYIALGMPFALMIGEAVVHPGPLPGSVSDYFYTSMGRVLVGALCAIAVFLITYRGYGHGDFIAMKVMAVAAIGVAWFPTVPLNPSPSDNVVGIFHGIFASVMFLTMTVTCLFLFTRSTPDPTFSTPQGTGVRKREMTGRKRQRNGVYRTCGIVMLGALSMIFFVLHFKLFASLHPVFWFELIAIEAFAVSWLVKGQAVPFLKDLK